MAKAYGALVDVLGGPQTFLQYKMLETGTYEKLALANAQAINGLQPKITSWNTGMSFGFHISSKDRSDHALGNGEGSADSMGPIRNLMQGLPPLLSTIHEQTGINPPSWMAQMPAKNHINGPNHAK